MKNIKKTTSERSLRQLKLINEYYPVDYENKTITLNLHYKKSSDILDTDIGDKLHPSFKTEILERVAEILDTFPLDFQVDLVFEIDDYEDYDPKIFIKSFKDELEFNHFQTNNDFKNKIVRSTSLLLIGIFIFFISAFGQSNNWFDSSTTSGSVLISVFDTLATLLIWEGFTVFFLEKSEHRVLGQTIILKIKSFSFIESKTKNVLAYERRLDIIKRWEQNNKDISINKTLILISGSLLIILGFISLISYISSLTFDNPLLSSFLLVLIVVISFYQIFNGINAIAIYKEKAISKKLVISTLAILIFVLLAVSIFNVISIFNNPTQITANLFNLIISILSFIASIVYLLTYIISNREIENDLL